MNSYKEATQVTYHRNRFGQIDAYTSLKIKQNCKMFFS